MCDEPTFPCSQLRRLACGSLAGNSPPPALDLGNNLLAFSTGLDKETLVFYFTEELQNEDTPESVHMQVGAK